MSEQQFNYEDSAIIRPPKQIYFDENNANRRYTRLVVDSRDRNLDLFPNPSKYEIELDEDINDVISAELIIADVPLKGYNINKFNNVIHVNWNGDSLNITIPEGNYDASTLLSVMNAVFTGATDINASYDSVKDKYTFRSAYSFSFVFKGDRVLIDGNQFNTLYKTNTCAQVIGFANKDYLCDIDSDPLKPFLLQSVNRLNFEMNNYAILNIDACSVNKSVNNVINKSFAIIGKSYTNMNIYHDTRIKKGFNPPIAKLSKLRITFKDYWGNLYDFQNHDHRIELHLEHLKNCRKYQSYANQ